MSTRRSTDDVLAAPAARREARSLTLTWFVTRCFFLLVFLVGAFVTFFMAVGAYQVVTTGLDLLSSESSTNWTTFGNASLDASDVELVKPLIGTHDRFDVVVTLWLDANRPVPSLHVEATEAAAAAERSELGLDVTSQNSSATSDTWSEAAAANATKQARETKLWSSTLFFNQTLASPISHAEVPVHIAKDLLSSWNATHGWLRASFSILPHSLDVQGGPLELLGGYALPTSVGPTLDIKALADLGDLMSLSDIYAPLTLRHYSNGTNSGRSQTYLYRRSRIGIISDQVDIPRLALLDRRMQLEQRVLECKVERAKPAGNTAEKCKRQIKDFAVEVELAVRNTSVADAQPQHRWAPRLTYSSLGHSPSEMLPVMDHRNDTEAHAIEKDIDFTWKVSFGSVTAKQAWMDLKIKPHVMSPDNFINSTFSKVSGHVVHEMIASVLGDQRHARARPWRRLMLYAFSHATAFLSYLLTTAYWYTRTTTAGVSTFGCYLRGFVLVVPVFVAVNSSSIVEGILSAVVMLFLLSGDILAVWTAVRLQLSWRGTMPVLRQLPALKAERDSHRLEARRTNWTLYALLLASFCALRYFGNETYLVAGAGVGRDVVENELDSRQKVLEWIALDVVLESILQLCAVLQLAHNARSRTFAGDLRLASYLTFASYVSVLLHRHASLVRGWSEHRDPFPITDIVWLIISTAYAWQAWNLPTVSQKISEDDDVVAL